MAEPDKIIEGTWNGLPYKGPPLNIKHIDSEDMLPQLKQTVHVKLFKLHDDKDREEYERVWQNISDGKAVLSTEDIKNTGGADWVSFLRWADSWYGPPLVLPEERADGPTKIV